MKTSIPYIIILVLGMVIGALCRGYFTHEVTIQKDTVTVYKTIQYSRLELQDKTIRLQVPDIHARPMVFIPADSVSIIYRDSIRYITLPRQNYCTRVKDAEIFHSGIESRIDSLNIFSTTANITQTCLPKEKKNYLALGIEASYIDRLYIPIYFQYSRMLHKNAEIYGRVMYDLPTRFWGVEIGTNVQFGW